MPDRLPITKLEVGSVSPIVLVCGDPGRAKLISQQLQSVHLINSHREYVVFQGQYEGRVVTVCSHGIGAAGAAIAFEELIVAGAQQLIRVGTCGGLQASIQSGDLIIATAAVDATGYGRQTVPDGFPAVAAMDLSIGLRRSARALSIEAYEGIVLSCDNFYAGVTTLFTPDYQMMSKATVLAVEMECSALFVVGSLRRIQTAAILAVDGNVLASGEDVETYQPHQERVQTAVSHAIDIVLNFVKSLD